VEIKIVDLTEENLKDLPEIGNFPYSCKYCIYWEEPEEFLVANKIPKEKLYQLKLNWLKSVFKSFGSPGKILYVDDTPVGFSQFAPPKMLPNVYKVFSTLPGKDAIYLSCLYIPNRKFQGRKFGQMMLESVIEEVRRRKFKAIETFARKNNSDNPSGPYEFYVKNGFKVVFDDFEFPLLRKEL